MSAVTPSMPSLPNFDKPPAPTTERAMVLAAYRAINDKSQSALTPRRVVLRIFTPLVKAGWTRSRAKRALIAQLDRAGMSSVATLRSSVGDDRFAQLLDTWWYVACRAVQRDDTDDLASDIWAYWWRLATLPWERWADRAVALAVVRRAACWRSGTVSASAAFLGAVAGLHPRTVQRVTASLAALPHGDPRKLVSNQSRPGMPLHWRVSQSEINISLFQRKSIEMRTIAIPDSPIADLATAPSDAWLGPRGIIDATHAIFCALAVADEPMSRDELAARLGRSATSRPVRSALRSMLNAKVLVLENRLLRLAPPETLADALSALAEARGTAGELLKRWAKYEETREARLRDVALHARVGVDTRVAEALSEALQRQALPWTLPSAEWSQSAMSLVISAVDGARRALRQAPRARVAGSVNNEDIGWTAGLALKSIPWPDDWGKTKSWAIEQALVIAQANK